MAGRELLASAGHDGTLRLWDPVTGDVMRRMGPVKDRSFRSSIGRDAPRPFMNWVSAVCAVSLAGQELLASGGYDGYDGTVRLWDPATGAEVRRMEREPGWVTGVCAVSVAGRHLLASAGINGEVRLWDPATGAEVQRMDVPRAPCTRCVRCRWLADNCSPPAMLGRCGYGTWQPTARHK